MKLLLGRFLPQIAGSLLALLAVVFIAWRVQCARLDTRTTERDAARDEILKLQEAGRGKDKTITALESSVEAWKKLATPDESMKAAAVRVETAAQQIAARAAALTPAEVKDHAKPDCAALLALDIARACPGIAAGVRARAAASGVRGPPGGGARAGGAQGR